jgi:putative RNA 2'-phosphotransferase
MNNNNNNNNNDQSKRIVSTSKFLSLVLRHEPGRIGISLGEGGWVPVAELLAACERAGKRISPALLGEVVASNDKQRFAFSDDGLRIRANQGHSVQVDLGLVPQVPPDRLYHGTASRFLASILKQGLLRGSRHHVHLTERQDVAVSVGTRHGLPVVLVVDALRMQQEGHVFYRSENGVWLTDQVGAQYLTRLQQEGTA